MPTIEEGMRRDIAAFLPDAIATALESYIAFSEEEATDPAKQPDKVKKSKEFKDHHDACKVCIAHIKLLIELAKWADIPPPELADEIQQQQLATIIGAANTELER